MICSLFTAHEQIIIIIIIYIYIHSVASSPQENYTDCATTVAWRISVPKFADLGDVGWWAWRFPAVVNVCFLDRNRLFSLSSSFSRGWGDPVPHQLLLRKSGSAGNRSRDGWDCSQAFCPLDRRGGAQYKRYEIEEKYGGLAERFKLEIQRI
jgi:hypothetical protein